MSSKENAGLANSEESELQHFEIQFLGLIQKKFFENIIF